MATMKALLGEAGPLNVDVVSESAVMCTWPELISDLEEEKVKKRRELKRIESIIVL